MSSDSGEAAESTTGAAAKCSIDLVNLAVCAPLLNVKVGDPTGAASKPCCAALLGLTDLEAAVCLCTALKADLLGLNVDAPLALNLLLSTCHKNAPPAFQCK
ncbi:unnamed protein product [Linum tenue]|uniref:Bifunctional inhibitor/plant lipid transfer protein/seed storage helical domain-containing protein n=1 Tax=Linum tenue TaxID=586396 RepID=A0AAV0H852_9ROSI|nr:unnamed protein product [Linum tenue]